MPPRTTTSCTLSFLLALLLVTGCGSNSATTTTTPPVQDVAITVQPLSQVVPIGKTATFSVTATGTGPLSYQWSENGVAILGANDATFSTPVVEFGGVGSTLIGSYQVVVSNLSSFVASNTATLIAGPRSPKAGDLRYLLFQQVSLPGLLDDGGLQSGVNCDEDCTLNFIGNTVGTPLEIGDGNCNDSGDCGWGFDALNLPPPMTGLTMYYRGDSYSSFTSDLRQWIDTSNIVVTSLDMEPLSGLFAMSWVETAQTEGFDHRLDVVSPAQIPATAASVGAASRIITAASFDASGNANLISYGWEGDTTTVYETQTTIAQHGEVCSAAATLANEGYIISAFGGNDTDGFMLIGMRVQGDSLPRSINDTALDKAPYFTPVVFLTDSEGDCYVNEQ